MTSNTIRFPLPLSACLLTTLALACVACETEGYDLIEELDGLAVEVEGDDSDDDSYQAVEAVEAVDALAAPAPAHQTVSGAAREGRLDFGAWSQAGTVCKTLSLANPFTANLAQVHIQASIDHANSAQAGRDATTVWVEDLGTSGARICVRETAQFNDLHMDGLSVSYRMFKTAEITSHANLAVSGRSDGSTSMDPVSNNHCTQIEFDDGDQGIDLSGVSGPIVVNATLTHTNTAAEDAASVWVTDLDDAGFTACIRERAGANMGHYNYQIDWLAYEEGAEPFAGESGQQSIPTNNKCTWVEFDGSYVGEPLIFAVIDRATSSSDNAGTVWVEDLTLDDPNIDDGFELCVRGMSNIDDTSAALPLDKPNMLVHWTAKSMD